jgi:hypothetical protein
LTVGMRIRIEDAYARKGFNGMLEISTRASSTIEVLV